MHASHYRFVSTSTETEIIVEMIGIFLQYVFVHFKQESLNNEEVSTKIKSRSNWNGIVDGLHSQKSLIKLMDKYESWKGFDGYVLLKLVEIL